MGKGSKNALNPLLDIESLKFFSFLILIIYRNTHFEIFLLRKPPVKLRVHQFKTQENVKVKNKYSKKKKNIG